MCSLAPVLPQLYMCNGSQVTAEKVQVLVSCPPRARLPARVRSGDETRVMQPMSPTPFNITLFVPCMALTVHVRS